MQVPGSRNNLFRTSIEVVLLAAIEYPPGDLPTLPPKPQYEVAMAPLFSLAYDASHTVGRKCPGILVSCHPEDPVMQSVDAPSA